MIHLIGFVDCMVFRKRFDKDQSQFSRFLELTKTKQSSSTIDAHRNEMLLTLLPEKVNQVNSTIEINCNTHISTLYGKIATQCNNLYSVIEKMDCSSCGSRTTENILFFPCYLNNFDVMNISKTLNPFYNTDKYCHKCGNLNKAERFPQDLIAFDTSGLVESAHLESIEKKMTIDNVDFNLHGAIEQAGNHFIAHLYRHNNWECYDDMRPQKKHIPSKSAKNLYIIFYLRSNH